jgi:hypothetical protein
MIYKVLTILFFIISGFYFAQAQEISCSDSLKLREMLREVRDRDQGDRARIIKNLDRKTPEEIKAAAIEMKISDKKNQVIIATLLDKCGWPQGLSSVENHTIFLVIDHADTAYMAKYFPLLKTQTELGVVSKNDFATMQDRILLRSGKKQIYGTQTFKVGTEVIVWPIADVGNVDSLRTGMGLSPMEDYMSLLKKTYRSDVIWDKAMTIEQAKQMTTQKK